MHSSKGDAYVKCLDGVGKMTIVNQEYLLHKEETIVMPANIPHAVYAQEKFKMQLDVVFQL